MNAVFARNSDAYIGETSVKCCEMLAAVSTTNVRSKSSSSIGKTHPTVAIATVNGKSIESRPCTSPPYELDHMYANNNICGNGGSDGGSAGDANFARRTNCASKLTSTATAASSSPCDVQRQLSCMRELVFLHLDLIQQQQEQLDSREKQIAALRQESKELRDQLSSAKARLTAFERENDQLRGGIESAAIAKNRHKSNGNRVRNCNTSSNESSTSKRIRCEEDSAGSLSAKKLDKKSVTIQPPPRLPPPPPPPPPPQPPKRDDLQTEVTYYTWIGATNAMSTPVVDESVLVPCWRVRLITSCYQMEGTENLDDDIFMKRHQKLEIDEKRRKRWDIQRIREQRLQEKLRKGRQAKLDEVRNRSPDLGSLYPRAEDVQAIEVAERLPVLAFGYPIPNILNSEFQVPWLDSLDKSWSEIGRTGRGSKQSTARRESTTTTTAATVVATDDCKTSKEINCKKHGEDIHGHDSVKVFNLK